MNGGRAMDCYAKDLCMPYLFATIMHSKLMTIVTTVGTPGLAAIRCTLSGFELLQLLQIWWSSSASKMPFKRPAYIHSINLAETQACKNLIFSLCGRNAWNVTELVDNS